MTKISNICKYDQEGRSCQYSEQGEVEINNLQDIALSNSPLPGEIPNLNNIDISGRIIPLNGKVGGDHIIYIDFNRRYNLDYKIDQASSETVKENLQGLKTKGGVLISDVAGHNMSDSFLTGNLHNSFLLGLLYELERHGEVTTDLFEKLNTRFYNSSLVKSSFQKFIAMIYGEVSEEGKFRFISAAQPTPIVFSNKEDKIKSFEGVFLNNSPPLGLFPSEVSVEEIQRGRPLILKDSYKINQIDLEERGDIILLHSDGLSDHNIKGRDYVPERLESLLQETKELSAEEISVKLKKDLLEFAEPSDDISYIVLKKV